MTAPAAKSVFADALDLPDPAGRAAYLDRACGGDGGLRAEVEDLLAAHHRAAGFLPPGPAGPDDPTADLSGHPGGPPNSDAASGAGAVVGGRYKLLERVGEGGMGEVWMAQQVEPVRRLVAVKLIKPGMDSRAVLARFEAERQALALMDHPNIARVLDGGLHDGRPYFVMELVKGVPITEYCDARKLPVRDRLGLFADVCRAVQHAHQKGVIHRDIKPSNVLVALYDDKPVVKVIDFGVAKATGEPLTAQTLFTGLGAVVGTPAYMAPEQATLNNLDVDTRADVYGLGALLYELLAGSPPFARADLQQRGLLEMLRMVREEEPPRPSTRLSTADARPSIAAVRGTEPGALARVLRSDLDWVVMKALEKDRSRRYDSATAFAADVERYLAGDAVLAAPPSRAYRLRKFARRNRREVAAAALAVLTLAAGAGLATVGFVQARQEQAEAEKQKNAADAERLTAERERNVANTERDRTGAISRFLQELLGQADPRNQAANRFTPNRDLTVRELLARASTWADARFGDQPDVRAAIHRVVGQAYFGVREDTKAVEHLEMVEKILGRDHPDNLEALLILGWLHDYRVERSKSLSSVEHVVAVRTRTLGPGHPDTLAAKFTLANAHNTFYGGSKDRAIELFDEVARAWAAARGRDDPDVLAVECEVLGVRAQRGLIPRSPAYYTELIAKRTRVRDLRAAALHPDDWQVLSATQSLATTLADAGRVDEAIPLLEDNVRRFEESRGPDHLGTLTTRQHLSEAYLLAGRPGDAVRVFERVWAVRAKAATDLNVVGAGNNLASYYRAARRYRAATALHEELMIRAKDTPDPDGRVVGGTAACYAVTLRRTRDFAGAARFQALAVAAIRKGGPLRKRDLFFGLRDLAQDYTRAGRPDQAVTTLEEARELARGSTWPAFHSHYAEAMLGLALAAAERESHAEPLLVSGFMGMRLTPANEFDDDDRDVLRRVADWLIDRYATTGRPADAQRWRTLRAACPGEPAPPPRQSPPTIPRPTD